MFQKKEYKTIYRASSPDPTTLKLVKQMSLSLPLSVVVRIGGGERGVLEEWGDPFDRHENNYSLLLNDSPNRLKQRSNSH